MGYIVSHGADPAYAQAAQQMGFQSIEQRAYNVNGDKAYGDTGYVNASDLAAQGTQYQFNPESEENREDKKSHFLKAGFQALGDAGPTLTKMAAIGGVGAGFAGALMAPAAVGTGATASMGSPAASLAAAQGGSGMSALAAAGGGMGSSAASLAAAEAAAGIPTAASVGATGLTGGMGSAGASLAAAEAAGGITQAGQVAGTTMGSPAASLAAAEAAQTAAAGGGLATAGKFALDNPALLKAGLVAGAGISAATSSRGGDPMTDMGDNDPVALARMQYEQQREDLAPYREQGVASLEDYENMLRGDYDWQASPAAQWTLQEGLKTQNRQDAARGLSGSGGASARAGELSSQVYAADYQQQYQRILDSLNLGQKSAAMQPAGNLSSTASSAANLASTENQSRIDMNRLDSGAGWTAAANTLDLYTKASDAGIFEGFS